MLSQYFGFQEEPFGATPDPRWLYRSATHREALASLQYGFYSNRGFTALIAPPGLGKTTLLYQFLHDIRNSARIVFLFDTQCEPMGLLRYILRDLGITPAINSDEMHEQLNEVLIKEARAGQKVVVVVDEAQNLSDEALEMLRLLTNFETPRAKLLQIVLAGQPLLAEKLMKHSMEQLRQRISTICLLEPFSMDQTTAYIRHRLEQAGYRGAPLFRKDALKHITVASRGIPRIINNLCFNALSLCCALKRKQVDGKMAAEVIADQELDPELRVTVESRLRATDEEQIRTEPLPQAEQPLQSEQRNRVEEPKPRRAMKFLVTTAAAILLVPGLGLLSHSLRWHSWPRLISYMHPLDTKVLSEPSPALTMKDVSRQTVAESAQVTSLDAKTLSASISAPAIANTSKIAVAEPPSSAKPFEVTIEPNQTLHDITVHYLGIWDVKRLHQIQALNPDLTDLDHIEVGQKMWLPAPDPALMARSITPIASGGNHHEP